MRTVCIISVCATLALGCAAGFPSAIGGELPPATRTTTAVQQPRIQYVLPGKPAPSRDVVWTESGFDESRVPVLEGFGLKPITDVTTNIRMDEDRVPQNVARAAFQKIEPQFQPLGYSRAWAPHEFAWVAPALCHRPLYFEDENLERYGHHFGLLQPAVSAAHFFGRVPVIPYMRGARSPHECVYTLGYYRPGNRVPFYASRPPLSLKGAALQGAAVTGAVFAIP